MKFELKNYDPLKHYAICASAGTGKTYNIVEILKKLKEIEDLRKILVVTYTEKAVGELKERIRKELGVATEDLPIFTIHSFCQNTIKEFGITASLPLNLGLVSDDEIYSFAKRYIREGKVLKDVSILKVNTDKFVEYLVNGAKKYYLDYSGNEIADIVVLKDGVSSAKMVELTKTILSCKTLNEMRAKIQEMDRHCQNLSNTNSNKESEFLNELEFVATKGFNFDGRSFQERYFKTTEGKEAFKYFKGFKDLLKDGTSGYYKMLASCYVKDFYLAWQEEKEKRKVQSYDDMLRYVRETIISNAGFKKKIQDTYTYGIIDENQDTNPKQFDIFRSIFMEDDKHHIVVVGDVKQSILAFQGGDSYVFQKAIDEIKNGNGVECSLDKNWRSTKEMVQTCNQFFKQDSFFGSNFQDSDYLEKANGDPFEHHAKYDEKDVKPFWIATADDKVNPIDMTDFSKIIAQTIIDCCTMDESGKTRLRINNGHDKEGERNVNMGDFAILARTRNEMPHILKALKNAGIPFIRYKDSNLFKGREAAHWRALLEAIATVDFTGSSRSNFRKALFTSFFGLDAFEISKEEYDRDNTTQMQQINEWKSMARESKWEEMIDDILMNSSLSMNVSGLEGIQSLAAYRQIGEYCIDILSSGTTLDGLISRLNRLSNGGGDEDEDENIVEKATDADCVQVMTMHASKGLEFPVVISAGGYTALSSNNPTVHIYHDDNDNNRPKLVFEKHSYCENKINEEEEENWKRLFYVANTRAQFVLILPYYRKYGMGFLEVSTINFLDNPGVKKIHDNGIDFETLRKEASKILNTSASSTSASSASEIEAQNQRMKKLIGKKSSQSAYKHSYSSLSHKNYIEEKDPDDDSIDKEGMELGGLSGFDKNCKPVSVVYDEEATGQHIPIDYPRGAALGTALHEIFENITFTDYENNIEDMINKCFSGQKIHLTPEWCEATKDMVSHVLGAELPVIHGSSETGETFKLGSLGEECLKKEAEFNFNIFGGKLANYCNGFIDLLFKNGDYYSILDWKSDILNDDFTSYADAVELKKQVDNRYSIQRVLYSYCLVKWLTLNIPGSTEEENFNHHFGGVYYVFLRGCAKDTGNGIYCQTWDSWETLRTEFHKILGSKGGK